VEFSMKYKLRELYIKYTILESTNETHISFKYRVTQKDVYP